jgi:hypothetical protein
MAARWLFQFLALEHFNIAVFIRTPLARQRLKQGFAGKSLQSRYTF